MSRAEYCEELADAEATAALGAHLVRCLVPGLVVHLEGELGAGKTTLVRGLLHGLGYAGAVTSPTYTLVEPYAVGGWRLAHFDLYRLADPEELEFLGLRDYLDGETVCLVEWPEKGAEVAPAPDLQLGLDYRDGGRHARIEARSRRGEEVLICLAGS